MQVRNCRPFFAAEKSEFMLVFTRPFEGRSGCGLFLCVLIKTKIENVHLKSALHASELQRMPVSETRTALAYTYIHAHKCESSVSGCHDRTSSSSVLSKFARVKMPELRPSRSGARCFNSSIVICVTGLCARHSRAAFIII